MALPDHRERAHAEELRILFGRLPIEEVTRIWEALREPYRRAQFGAVLLLRGDVASAVDALGRARDLAPDDAEVRRNLAVALVTAGEPDAAGVELTAALRADPAHHQARVDLGVLRLAAGHPAEALSHLDTAAADGVLDRRCALHRAIALRELGRVEGAAPILKELAGCDDPDYAERARVLLASAGEAGGGECVENLGAGGGGGGE